MISLTPVIDALRLARPALPSGLVWFRQVEGGAAFARVADLPSVPLPGCWVVRTGDASMPDGERVSVTTVSFDVVMGVTNHRMATAGDSDDVLLAYRRAVLDVLQEWEFDPSQHMRQLRPLERTGGQAIEYSAGDLWWKDTYRFTARIDNFLPDPPAFDRVEPTPHPNF